MAVPHVGLCRLSVGCDDVRVVSVQVYLASIQTCSLPNAKSAPPGAFLSLLDFEPLVFEGFQEVGEKDGNYDRDGRAGRPPAFACSDRGKSCIFTAEPVPLSRALRLPGALTLMLASRLSTNQVGVEERSLSWKPTNDTALP